jgi:hypothetical protein
MDLTLEAFKNLFERDINRLKKEIAAYPSQESLWITGRHISNSAGNLCLHLCGNLQHFVGAVLGNSSYVRQRDKEFSDKNVHRNELLKILDETQNIAQNTFARLDCTILEKIYPEIVFGYETSTLLFLIHLQGHLNYHLGQINYHRRLLA